MEGDKGGNPGVIWGGKSPGGGRREPGGRRIPKGTGTKARVFTAVSSSPKLLRVLPWKLGKKIFCFFHKINRRKFKFSTRFP